MKSEIVIAHLSDLHYPVWREETWDNLKHYLTKKNPQLILITGDLTEHPWPWRQFQVRAKLLDLLDSCKMDGHSPELLIIPGNHDYAFWGNVNLSGILARFVFKFVFRQFTKRFFEMSGSDAKILLFCFDSNPRLAKFAKGVVSRRQLKLFQRKVHELRRTDRNTFDYALKIAVLHHHPLPIPYSESFEHFMVLKNAGEFIRYLAQCRVDLVLHGHKHNAVISSVVFDSVSSGKRKITVVASGSTLKKGESHNSLNIIAIRKSLPTEVTQVFASPGNDFEEKRPLSVPQWVDFIEDQHATYITNLGYIIEKITRTVVLDEEGDGKTSVEVDELKVLSPQNFKGVDSFAVFVEDGSIAGFDITGDPSLTSEFHVAPEPAERPRRVQIDVPAKICSRGTCSFGFNYWTLKAWGLDSEEHERKYAEQTRESDRNKSAYEEVEYLCTKPINMYVLEIQLPSNCCPKTAPRLLAYYPNGTEYSEAYDLERHLSPVLNYSRDKNVIFVRLQKPILGYKYVVRWYLPTRTVRPINIKHARASQTLIGRLLDLSTKAIDKLSGLMKVLERLIRQELKIQDNEIMDVTLSVPFEQKGKPTSLKLVASNTDNIDIKESPLFSVGEGTSGRAFKENRIRSYVEGRVQPNDPKKNIYVRFGNYVHKVLYSVPLRHPHEKELVIGVLSVGSPQINSSLIPQDDTCEEEISRKIAELARCYAVPRLNDLCENVIQIVDNEDVSG